MASEREDLELEARVLAKYAARAAPGSAERERLMGELDRSTANLLHALFLAAMREWRGAEGAGDGPP